MPRNNSRRSNSRSRSRSRSRTRSHTRSRSRDRNYRGRDSHRDRYDDRDNRASSEDQCRVHIADLSQSITKAELEKAFGKFGELGDTWMAKNPPCFAFIVYKNKEDAEESIREMNGR
jgi:arginine/serine-rich splicing factor 7